MREHRADAAAAQDVALGAQHGEVGAPRRAVASFVAGLHVQQAERDAADLAGQPAAGAQRRLAPAVEADAAAEEQIRRVARSRPPARRWRGRRTRRCRGPRGRSRASPGKNRLKRVRFTCCSSTSTCAKSVLIVRSAVRFCVTPYFTSTPTRARAVVATTAASTVLSVVDARRARTASARGCGCPTAPAARPAWPPTRP